MAYCRINTTLEHLRDIVQYYTVFDTALDDNTIEQVQELMGDVPGQVIRDGPLTSFSEARNRALRVSETSRLAYSSLL